MLHIYCYHQSKLILLHKHIFKKGIYCINKLTRLTFFSMIKGDFRINIASQKNSQILYQKTVFIPKVIRQVRCLCFYHSLCLSSDGGCVK